jgi:hypothetical protein
VTDAAALPALATYLDQVVPLALQEQTALNAASDAAPIKSLFGDVLTTLQATDAAAKGTDVAGFTSAYATFTTANTKFHDAATMANLPNCAK